jgi:hypothetical protein
VLILHIGFHKAGSTTLQTALAKSAAAMADAGVVYPAAGRGRQVAHHAIATAIQTGAALPEIADVAALAAQRTVVLSSERFSLCDPAQVRARLGPARIVCYRRDMLSGAVSRYRQVTRRGTNRLCFDDLLPTGRIHFFSAPVLAAWAEVFGPDCVRVRSLDSGCLDGGDLLTDFAGAMGAVLTPTSAQNVSPGWRALECIRAFAVGSRDPVFIRRRVRPAMEAAAAACGLVEQGLYLSAEQISRLGEEEEEDREGLLALGLDGRLAPAAPIRPRDFMPAPEAIEPDRFALLLEETRRRMGPHAAALVWDEDAIRGLHRADSCRRRQIPRVRA